MEKMRSLRLHCHSFPDNDFGFGEVFPRGRFAKIRRDRLLKMPKRSFDITEDRFSGCIWLLTEDWAKMCFDAAEMVGVSKTPAVSAVNRL